MELIKQTVYLPVKEESDEYPFSIRVVNKEQVGYFFTPEELNEYTSNVIKQTLEIAAKKAEIKKRKVSYSSSSGSEYGYVQCINKESITNTFEQTFKQYEV